MSNNPNTSFKIASEDEFRSDAKGLAAKLNAVAANPNQLMSGGDVPWSTGLFDCGPANLCALTCLCPCITFGRTHSRLSKSGNLDDYSCCNLAVSQMPAALGKVLTSKSVLCVVRCRPLGPSLRPQFIAAQRHQGQGPPAGQLRRRLLQGMRSCYILFDIGG